MTDQNQTPPEEPAGPDPSNPASEQPAATPGDPAQQAAQDERNMALLCHLLGFLTSIIGPLIIWLIKKDSSAYVNHHGREALNFQITMLIGYIISSVTAFIIVGCVIGIAVFVVDLVFSILAAVAASRGEWYRYPIALRLIQ